MKRRIHLLRHLPPTAVPIRASDLQSGLRNPDSALPQFQSALASYLGVSEMACRLASSGRTALYQLLLGLKVENPHRDQVVMPAYTCPAVARVVIDLALQPRFVDISAETLQYKSEQLGTAVCEKTLAVVHVHPFGISLPVENLIVAAHEAGAVVIEDAAQAFGARWDGTLVGTMGDFGLFSLGPGKPISTGGGGIAISNNSKYLDSLDKWWNVLPESSSISSAVAWFRQAAFQVGFHPFAWWAATRVGLHRVGNHESSWGYTLQGLSPSQAGVGLSLLGRLDNINVRRRQIASRLKEAATRSKQVQTFSVSPKAEAIYLRFPILAESTEHRKVLYEKFWSAGIGVGRLYEKSLPTIFDTDDSAAFPGAEAVASRLLTLPTHHYVTDDDIQTMSAIMRRST